MDKATRTNLLRDRLKARGWKPFPISPSKSQKPAKATGEPRYWLGAPQSDWFVPHWVKVADKRPKTTVQPKRRKGVSALAKIAQKLPTKLKRLPLPGVGSYRNLHGSLRGIDRGNF